MNNKIEEIKNRWNGNLIKKCEECSYEMTRHFYRNMESNCETPDELYDKLHNNKYDGTMISYAGQDISDLLDIIDQYQNK